MMWGQRSSARRLRISNTEFPDHVLYNELYVQVRREMAAKLQAQADDATATGASWEAERAARAAQVEQLISAAAQQISTAVADARRGCQRLEHWLDTRGAAFAGGPPSADAHRTPPRPAAATAAAAAADAREDTRSWDCREVSSVDAETQEVGLACSWRICICLCLHSQCPTMLRL